MVGDCWVAIRVNEGGSPRGLLKKGQGLGLGFKVLVMCSEKGLLGLRDV